MAKKRKCRYTPEELAIHDEAVRLRKMTDAQLVQAFREAAEPPCAAFEESPTEKTNPVKKLIEGLSRGDCKGVKGATVYKIEQYAAEVGLI
ncbi:MAG: hypothetical protein IJX94_01265 [Clostridia bacterium]|nr:hypothetical protein [Clostridia bacterium]